VMVVSGHGVRNHLGATAGVLMVWVRTGGMFLTRSSEASEEVITWVQNEMLLHNQRRRPSSTGKNNASARIILLL
jgi:hypothetical protein